MHVSSKLILPPKEYNKLKNKNIYPFNAISGTGCIRPAQMTAAYHYNL
jgi:hypothetical protein